MIAIIHIQEINSTQVSEITAKTIEDAIWAYAYNAAFDWEHFEFARLMRYPKSEDINWMEFEFITEKLIVRHIYGERYTAQWVEL